MRAAGGLCRAETFLVSGVLTLSMAEPGVAQWPTGTNIVDTPHNLTRPAKNQDPDMVDQIADYDEVCVYCHGLHGGSESQALWNRPTPAGPYRMYEDPTDMLLDPQPTGNSLACLSCHDGTVGLDMVLVPPSQFAGPTWGVTIDDCEGCHSGGSPDGGIDWEGVWLDTDLRKQHPISLLYDPAADPGFRSAAEVEAAGLKLFDGKVQCMTCHEPHTQVFRPFLRVTDSGGSICLVCHVSMPAESTAHFW
jgi:predicted CXXCH cytochrome family protein